MSRMMFTNEKGEEEMLVQCDMCGKIMSVNSKLYDYVQDGFDKNMDPVEFCCVECAKHSGYRQCDEDGCWYQKPNTLEDNEMGNVDMLDRVGCNFVIDLLNHFNKTFIDNSDNSKREREYLQKQIDNYIYVCNIVGLQFDIHTKVKNNNVEYDYVVITNSKTGETKTYHAELSKRKFICSYSQTVYYDIEVEAEDEDAAWEVADDKLMDGLDVSEWGETFKNNIDEVM